MKQVLNIHEEVQMINVSEINNNSFVGIEWNEGSDRSIIIKKADNEFTGMQINSLNISHSWVKFSKKDYIMASFEQRGIKVFVFDNYKELINWSLKNN